MRFQLWRLRKELRRMGEWLVSFGRGLRRALASRFVLVPLLCLATVWTYSRYVTHWNLFVIFDRDEVIIHGTYTRDYEAALAEAGIHIRGNDIVSLPKRPLSGGGAEIQIIRTVEVTVTFDSVTVPIICLGGTVADALVKAGYAGDPRDNVRDIIEPSPETPVEEGMEIVVTRYVILTEVESEEIPFETEDQQSANVNFGASIVTVEGEAGERRLSYEVIFCDGVEIFRGEPQTSIVKDPVTEVVVHGTGGTVTLNDGTKARYTKRLEVVCTAYTTERQTNKINAIGNIARVGTIAVDPKVIPLRINVVVTSRNGSWHYGEARTEDTGGVIKGNIIDLFFDTYDECIKFGRRTGYLYILA